MIREVSEWARRVGKARRAERNHRRDGSTRSGSRIDEIVREGARRMLTAALEAEVNQYIAELTAETDEYGRCLVVRNGHHRPRTVVTAAGPVEAKAPRVNDHRVDDETGERQRFSSKILLTLGGGFVGVRGGGWPGVLLVG